MPSTTRNLSRRQFLHLAATASGGLLLCACGRAGGTAGAGPQVDNYYVQKKDKIVKEVKKLLRYIEQAATTKFDAQEAARLADETLPLFEEMLPGLPFIGGAANDLTANLYQSAAALALYRVMLAHQHTLEETGEILYRTVQLQMSSSPLMGAGGRMAMSELMQQKIRDEATLSQLRTYPQDWVFDFVPGDGETFTYGVDYTECGICKYYQAQGAGELTPYLCLLDFPMSEGMNTGLVRTTTLGQGGARCDFRYQAGRPCQREWTPDFLKQENA